MSDETGDDRPTRALAAAIEAMGALRTELLGRLDGLSQEVRRQGRASLAAQAAAESCQQAIAQLASDPDEPPPSLVPPGAEARRWLQAMLPVLDAIDRVAEQASGSPSPAAPAAPARSWWSRWRRPLPPPAPDTGDQAALNRGLQLLRPLAEQSLASLGVQVERRTGIPLDTTRHRVVEVRPPSFSSPRVLEVVRAGYQLDGQWVREADVVASAPPPSRPLRLRLHLSPGAPRP